MKTTILSILLGLMVITGTLFMDQPVTEAASLSPTATAQANKKLVKDFWNGVFNQKDTHYIDTSVGEKYIQHNPGFKDGKTEFKSAIIGYLEEFPQSSAEIKRIVAEDDYVFIHNHVKINPADAGQAAVDIFRVKDGKIIEHWDVLQNVPPKAENSNTMF